MPPTIFFSATSKHNAAHAECIRHIFNEIIAPTLTNQVEPIQCITDDPVQILQQLKKQQNSIALFHFGGRDHEFQALLDASPQAGIDSLPEYLADLPQLDLVFLSYCSRKRFVEPLRSAGIEVVVGTSRHIAHRQAKRFATVFYRQFLVDGHTTKEAFEEATRSIGISQENRSRQYAEIHGNKDLRWWKKAKDKLPTPHIFEGKSSIPIPETILLPPAPFPGEQPFQRQDAHVFLGRHKELILLCNHLATPSSQPITLLYGANGVGKSSFLNAGLLPRLEDSFEIYHLSGQQKPKLFEAMCQIIDTPTLIPTAAFWASWLNQQSKSVLLVIDQFEPQLLSQNSKMQVDLVKVMTAIRILLSGPTSSKRLCVIFSIRNANLAQLQNLLMNQNLLSQTHYFPIKPLNEDGIRNALYGFAPYSRLAIHYGFSIEDTITERIVADLTQDQCSPIAPFLQAIFVKLWKESATTAPHPFSLRHYQQIYCEGALLRDFLNSQLAQVRRQWLPIIRYKKLIDLLITYTTFATTAEGPKAAATASTALLTDRFKNFYLLTEKGGRQGNELQLGHKLLERPLSQEFYRLTKGYARADEQNADLHSITEQIASNIALYTTKMQAWGKRLVQRCWGGLNRRVEVTRGLLALFTLAIGAFLFFLHWPIQQSLQQLADSMLINVPDTPALLSGFQATSIPLINAADLAQQSTGIELKRVSLLYTHDTLPANDVSRQNSVLAFSIDSALLVAGGSDNTLEIWSVTDAQPHPALLMPARVTALSIVDAQEQVLIYGMADGHVGHFQIDALGHITLPLPNETMKLPGHNGSVAAMQLSADGSLLLTGGQDGAIYQYDKQTSQATVLRDDPTNSISALALHPNQALIAFGGANAVIYIWDRTVGKVSQQLTGHTGSVTSLAFSRDGTYILSASNDGTLCLWLLATASREHCFTDFTTGVTVARYSPDDSMIIAGGDDGHIRLWNSTTYQLLAAVEAHSGGVATLAVRKDGKQLASADWNGGIVLWDITIATRPLH